MKQFFSDSTNWIEKIFVKEVNTESLCVPDDNGGKLCLDKTELFNLIKNSKSKDVLVTTPAPIVIPIVETTPETTSTPEPAPEVIQTPEPTQVQPQPETNQPSVETSGTTDQLIYYMKIIVV